MDKLISCIWCGQVVESVEPKWNTETEAGLCSSCRLKDKKANE